VRDDLPTIVELLRLSFSWDPAISPIPRPARPATAPSCVIALPSPLPVETLYAYCREDGGRVHEVREKEHFTPTAPQEYAPPARILRVRRPGQEIFTIARDSPPHSTANITRSLVYNPMIRDGLKVLCYEIRSSSMGDAGGPGRLPVLAPRLRPAARWPPPPFRRSAAGHAHADSERACRF